MRKNTRTTWVALACLIAASGAQAGEAVNYTVGGLDYEGYYERAADSRGLVLIIHDWDGLTDYEKQRAAMLAEEGYSVFAADLFGAGVRPTETTDKQRLTGALYADREQMRRRMLGALAAAQGQGADVSRAVAIGYCFGGTAVLELARSGELLKGFASFHGGLSTPDGQSYQDTVGKVMVYHGSADTSISMQQFATLTDELEAQKVSHEMITYSGAPHAFSVFGSTRYQEQADRQSWASFTHFLGEVLP